MIDSKKRTLIKAVTWRVMAIILLSVITYLLTNNIKTVTYITIFYHGLQILVYFFHERIWNYIKWGKTKGILIQMTGLSGSGKTTLSRAVAKRLIQEGYKIELIDGDEYRTELCKDLGFSKEDRNENIHRLSFVGRVLSKNNVIAIMAVINPYDDVRQQISNLGSFVKTVYIKSSLDTLIERDPKGLYKKALNGDIDNFTGISDPFEVPTNPDLIINTDQETIEKSVDKLYRFITQEINS